MFQKNLWNALCSCPPIIKTSCGILSYPKNTVFLYLKVVMAQLHHNCLYIGKRAVGGMQNIGVIHIFCFVKEYLTLWTNSCPCSICIRKSIYHVWNGWCCHQWFLQKALSHPLFMKQYLKKSVELRFVECGCNSFSKISNSHCQNS